MRTLRRSLPPLLGLAALILVVGGGALGVTLAAAREDAEQALLDRPGDAADPAAGRALAQGRRDEAADRLGDAAAKAPSAEAHDLASLAALAAGRFDDAARDAALAARLVPGDAVRAARTDHLLDLAMMARVWPALRVGTLLGLITLLVLGVRARRRALVRRRLASWIHGVRADLAPRVDGRTAAGPALVMPGDALSLDLFFRAKGRPARPPAPGPTLLLVLSHAASSRSIRLTPRRGIRQDAVRTRVREATLGRLLERPGRWRAQALLDGRLVAEAPLEVAREVVVARSA